MRGITFNNLPPIRPAEPGRMDVVCFIGFAPLARQPLFSNTLKRWLMDHGWKREKITLLSEHHETIFNTPVPLESWDAFCAVFDDRRLDRMGRLRSRPLADPMTISDKDSLFYVIVDQKNIRLTLTPDTQGRITRETLVAQINDQLADHGASVFFDSDSGEHLIVQRNDSVTHGELTVYANESLGFPQAVQADSFYIPHYTGAAIKAFFRQGGRKCYFISMGNTLPHHADDHEKDRQLYTLIWGKKKADAYFVNKEMFTRSDYLHILFPGIPNGAAPVAEWNSLSHLAGISDVTYLCFPDMVDVLGKPSADKPEEPVSEDEEVFTVCSEPEPDAAWFFTEFQHVPEYDRLAFSVWKRVVRHILSYLSVHARTVQLVAGLPMPAKEMRRDFSDFVSEELLSEPDINEIHYRHLQLVFPWLKTDRSGMLPQALEPPEGLFLGIMAAQSRQIGAFRSIAGSGAESAYDLSPLDIDAYGLSGQTGLSFSDRVSWFDFVPGGIQLQSDVTAVLHGNYRYGAVRRIMILVQRAAHRIGLDHVFEPGSERIWRNVRDSLTDLLQHIYLKNGLRGKSSKDAYSVTCGRSTMTQNDIDNGRLIANVSLQPAVPIERIAVDVLLERNGAVLFGKDTE